MLTKRMIERRMPDACPQPGSTSVICDVAGMPRADNDNQRQGLLLERRRRRMRRRDIH